MRVCMCSIYTCMYPYIYIDIYVWIAWHKDVIEAMHSTSSYTTQWHATVSCNSIDLQNLAHLKISFDRLNGPRAFHNLEGWMPSLSACWGSWGYFSRTPDLAKIAIHHDHHWSDVARESKNGTVILRY